MKKNKLCFILGAAFIVNSFSVMPAMSAMSVNAEEKPFEYEDLEYEIADDGHVIITNCYQNAEKCTIPEEIDGAPVTEIADSAFSECYFLKEVTVPDSVKIIGRQAFSACSELKTVKLPVEIEQMGAGVFDACPVLESVTVPKGISELPEATFYECKGLKTVIMPEGIEVINSESFYGCESLSEITFPDSLTTIGDYAFQGCSSLKIVTLTENVHNLGSYIFFDCKSLSAIETADENSMFTSRDGVLFTKDGITLVRYPEAKKDESYAIPEGCMQLANGSFVDAVYLKNIDLGGANIYGIDVFFRCTGLESIVIPEGANSVSSNMFSYCSSMKNISLPSTLKYIEDYAFYTCAALTEVTVPEGTEKIGAYSFFNCIELRTLHLPDSITEIGDGAMGYYAESEDTEPKKFDGFTVEYSKNDVIHGFVEQYDLNGTGHGSSKLWIWFAAAGGVILLAGAVVLIVVLRRRAYIPRPVKGGRTGSATKRSEQKKKG